MDVTDVTGHDHRPTDDDIGTNGEKWTGEKRHMTKTEKWMEAS